MKVTILGTGTSCGVPQIGCHCAVCMSEDPRDKRLRCSALVETNETRILLDCGPDFREQMLRVGFDKVLDAVFITHEHYDHVGGLDDLRPFSYMQNLPVYADPYAASHLRQRLPYCLVEHKYPGIPHAFKLFLIVLRRIERSAAENANSALGSADGASERFVMPTNTDCTFGLG